MSLNTDNLSQCGFRVHTDLLIIGSGLAGLLTALELSRLRPQTKIALVTKKTLQDSNSFYAQGGIAAALDTATDKASHVADTLAAGQGLSRAEVVKQIIELAPSAINTLLDYGVIFDKNAQAEFDLHQEGGHTLRRIYHVGDTTGLTITQALIKKIKQQKNITLYSEHTAVNLISLPGAAQPGRLNAVCGAYVLENNTEKIHCFLASQVVLATGGAGKVYRYTSNPDTATGDGIAMAYRAGARVGNMEFYQFHPTLLHHPEVKHFLLTEALRGEGAYLRLKNGERFMSKYAPNEMELARRDVVARAIFTEIEHSPDHCVYLDITHRDRSFLTGHFPNIFHTLLELGIDLSKDWVPVVPGAHYLCGGVLADINGSTDIPNLYALGETAFTGFHGANRLASNSLLEATVMAKKLAEHLSTQTFDSPDSPAIANWNSPAELNTRRASQINAHWRGLRGEMMSYAGIVRTAEGLKDLLHLIQVRKKLVEEYYWGHRITMDLIELRNIIQVAELITSSALQREESRGAHYREDFLQMKDGEAEETITREILNSVQI